jgi:hypothetical protein
MAILLDFRLRAQGKLTFQELGRRLELPESDHLEASSLGCAVRTAGQAKSGPRDVQTAFAVAAGAPGTQNGRYANRRKGPGTRERA